MAIKNPAKNFNFKLSLGGIDLDVVQMITAPPVELTEHKQGSPGMIPDLKTPGKPIIGDLVVEVVIPDTGNGPLWNKIKQAKTLVANDYMGNGFLYRTDVNGAPVQTFAITNAWLKKIETANYETTADNSADLKETLTFSLQNYDMVG